MAGKVPEPSVRRILRVYRAATAAQLEEGSRWYERGHDVAASLDPNDPRRAAGVLAALSPRVAWARNLELAARLYDTGRASGTLGMSLRAADKIYAGADPLAVLKGPKVRAFFSLLADPAGAATAGVVCVDRHAIDVAVGRRLAESERSTWYPLDRRGLYGKFAACYVRAGLVLGVRADWVQATTWVRWRECLLPPIKSA